MIEQIKGIKINGRCFQTDTNLTFFPNPNNRISIVYGKNGSGKSTLSEGIACIPNNGFSDGVVATLFNNEGSFIDSTDNAPLFVFNEKYIDENVKINDDGLGTIILFGNQVDLQSEIDKVAVTVEFLTKEYEAIDLDYANYDDLRNPLNPLYHWARIGAILKQAGGWAETDSKIKGNRRNSSVTDEIIKEICNLNVKESSSALQKSFEEKQSLLSKISEISSTYPEEIKTISHRIEFEKNIIELLAKQIEEPVLSDREKLILETIQSGGQRNVENARNSFTDNNVKVCPYCYQTVSETYKASLVISINKVLNKDVDEHKKALTEIGFPVVEVDIEKYESIDKALVKTTCEQIKKCQELIDKYRALLREKENNVYTPIVITELGLTDEILKLNRFLSDLNKKRIEFNIAATKKRSITNDLVYLNKQIAHLRIEQVYKDYQKQRKKKDGVFKQRSEKYAQLNTAKDKLKALQQKKANIGLAISGINNSLDYVFFSRGRLSIELNGDKYYLKTNGKNVKPKNVSLGERNIIALCYFFTQIMSNQEVSKLYTKESFIVIDDPISSFDFENKVGIISFLRYQMNRIISGNGNSKILLLSHDLETVFSLIKAAKEICDSTKGISGKAATHIALELNNLSLSPINEKYSEYSSLLKTIYHFAAGDNDGDSMTIGNAIRRVLEAFSTFIYRKGIDKITCDKEILKSLGDHSVYFENLMYRLVLHGESHYVEQINSIHDGNNFFGFISLTEKKKLLKMFFY